jgi:hypothetical protein
LKNGAVPPEIMSCGRIFGSIVFTNFNFDVENTVAISPIFYRLGFGIYKLQIIGGSITLNLLYLMLENVRDSVEIIELRDFSMQNTSNLKIFTGTSRFSKLKDLVLCSTEYNEIYSIIFQQAPILHRLSLAHNFDIIVGKTMMKKLSIGGGFVMKHGGKTETPDLC